MYTYVCVFQRVGVFYIYIENFPSRMIMLPQRVIDYVNKIPKHQAWNVLFWIVGLSCPRDSQNIQALALGCHLEIESKSLVLKTSCTSETGHRKPELDQTWKLPLWGLTFLVPEGTMQDFKEEKHPRVFFSCDAYEPYQEPA